jgi:hypothetical protein
MSSSGETIILKTRWISICLDDAPRRSTTSDPEFRPLLATDVTARMPELDRACSQALPTLVANAV